MKRSGLRTQFPPARLLLWQTVHRQLDHFDGMRIGVVRREENMGLASNGAWFPINELRGV